MTRIVSKTYELIPRSELAAAGLELRGATTADFGYPDGLDLFECLWFAVRNAVLDSEREARNLEPAA